MLLAADDTAALASALGLTFDAQPVFGGPRLKRGVLVVNDGVVEYAGVEDSPGDSASPSLFFLPLHALSEWQWDYLTTENSEADLDCSMCSHCLRR